MLHSSGTSAPPHNDDVGAALANDGRRCVVLLPQGVVPGRQLHTGGHVHEAYENAQERQAHALRHACSAAESQAAGEGRVAAGLGAPGLATAQVSGK